MSGWRQIYEKRKTFAERAVAPIRSGRRIFVGSGAAEPQTLCEALARRADRLADTELMHVLTLGVAVTAEQRFADHFRHNAFFVGANTRDAVNECRADYTPIFLSELPALFRRGQIPLDFALVQLSPPDDHGYCSLGVSVDVVKAAVETARWVVGEVNRRMPRTLGDSFVHVSRLNAIVESDRPLLELPPTRQSEETARIGRFVAELIEDGATIQVGIGGIPDAVLSHLTEEVDLGIHTEMFSDGLIDLVESGVVTGRRKSLHPGKMIATFCMGTQRLYDFVHDNPAVEFRPTEYVNDPFTIARNDRMVAINSAMEVDLTGQVCADSLGDYFFSGFGGQADFMRGAARSKGGKPIIALPSLARTPEGDPCSRIVPRLMPGAGVVTTRGDVHYVVTEWGIAYLHGKSIRERAMALIMVAHPDFRSELLAAAKGRRLVMPDQTDRALTPRYPEELEGWLSLSDGAQAFVRPIRPTDEDLIREFHYRLSEETVYRRYRRPLKSLPHSERVKLVSVDYDREMAIVVLLRHEGRDELLGVGRYYVDEETRVAEVAFTVRDDFHDRGIGSLLARRLVEVARGRELAGLDAYVQPDNTRMLTILIRNGFQATDQGDSDTTHWRVLFHHDPPEGPDLEAASPS
ncbi:MAG TPA: GNAT family N-acetyltransferase [Chthonomonadales bacterium]|nr:GNAT family N-acetyltransferase [Chthonomonadales bacterium]